MFSVSVCLCLCLCLVSHGGQEGVSGQVCWNSPMWRRTPGWCQHHDQKQSSNLQKLIHLECLSPLISRQPSRMSRVGPCHTALNRVTPCGFSAATDPDLRHVLADICSPLDPGAKLFACLDDRYLWVKPTVPSRNTCPHRYSHQVSQP